MAHLRECRGSKCVVEMVPHPLLGFRFEVTDSMLVILTIAMSNHLKLSGIFFILWINRRVCTIDRFIT